MKEREILWKDLKVGDKFIDGSSVVEIFEEMDKKCIEMKLANEEPITISFDHMLKLNIIEDGYIINNRLLHSESQRIKLSTSQDWVSAYDVMKCMEHGATVVSENSILEYARVANNGKPMKCFCIRTDTGHYSFNGFTHHNSARFLFYGLSDMQVIDDCGAVNSRGPIDCKAPGICRKCAAKGGWKVKEGDMVGGVISTHLTEGLTQASLNAIHTGTGEKADWEVIKDTLFGFKSSPIIESAQKKKTTAEARQTIFDGLKDVYEKAGINIDDYNIQVVAKQLTSYKRENDGSIRYVKDNELCDFPSMQTIGGHNNLFLQSLLRNSYDKLTHPSVFNNEANAVTGMAD